jgi:hypothetical protein
VLNWSIFENLQGAPEDNFEMLCRSLVWVHYGKYGKFRARANQPGVEFHLQLTSDCSLGQSGKWFGWQCKWYTIPRGKSILTSRRKDIEESLEKSLIELPELTDWILCTRYPLTDGDQRWYYGLTKKINLHLWPATGEIGTLLSGDGEIFRLTYFGDLIMSNDRLKELHQQSVAPIKKRWFPEVHQPVHAEKKIYQMLAEYSSWGNLNSIADDLQKWSLNIEKELSTLPELLIEGTRTFIHKLEATKKILEEVSISLQNSDLDLLSQQFAKFPTKLEFENLAMPRKLRGARLACGTYATNALSDLRRAVKQLADVKISISNRFVAIVADAGGGKTQLCAQITQANSFRPAGILILGRFLTRGKSLDDLASKIVLNGKPVSSMNGLLAALNAAAQRNKCRLPLVIDGLNEAEDPREWKPLLASLIESLREFPRVLVVCTLRTGGRGNRERNFSSSTRNGFLQSFAEITLPEEVHKIEIPDFENDAADAIKKYFTYFRIKGNLRGVPIGILRHPLTLRIFCEVANPNRNKDVGIESVPRSLVGLFEKYIQLGAERIAELSDHSSRIYAHDINQSLYIMGKMLWESNKRELDENKFRKEIGDMDRSWGNCLVTYLEQEGFILRSPGDKPGSFSLIPVYDLLGGYLIANFLITDLGRNEFSGWLKQQTTLKLLSGDYTDRNPLADDIFGALVSLVPRRLHSKQLWQLVEEPLRTKALGLSILLEATYLDSETIKAIQERLLAGGLEVTEILRRLFVNHGVAKHPLNAEFLTMALSQMSVAARDIIWTEWLRKNLDHFITDSISNIDAWKNENCCGSDEHSLTATWTMWMLTTTSVKLRYLSTKALYYFGRMDPESLFSKTLDAAKINDPYVFERMMAASYGTAMALVSNQNSTSFITEVLPSYARKFFDALFEKKAPHRTTHLLARDYALHFIKLSIYFNNGLFTANESKMLTPPFKNGGMITWSKVKTDKKLFHQPDSPIKMDFENYTIGSLVTNRAPYDFNNQSYIAIHNKILWRILNLGWNKEVFGEIDKSIESGRDSHNRQDNNINKIDRYGKKYSWIAYFEIAGWLEDIGKNKKLYIEQRTWDLDIDPSFPEPCITQKIVETDLLGNHQIQTQNWFKDGKLPSLAHYLNHKVVAGIEGPWVVLDAYLSRTDEELGRSIFTFIRSFLVSKNKKNDLVALLQNQHLGGRWLPEKPVFRSVFSGEIPWSEVFLEADVTTLEFELNKRESIVHEEIKCYYLDNKEITLSRFDELRVQGIDLIAIASPNEKYLSQEDFERLEERTEVRPVRKVINDVSTIDVIMPVVDIHPPGHKASNKNISGHSLAKNISRLLGLRNIPQSHDLQTTDGIRATIQTNFQPESYSDSEYFVFIKKQMLESILRDLDLDVVWAAWGEKEFSFAQFELFRNSGGNMNESRGDIKEIYTLER